MAQAGILWSGKAIDSMDKCYQPLWATILGRDKLKGTPGGFDKFWTAKGGKWYAAVRFGDSLSGKFYRDSP